LRWNPFARRPEVPAASDAYLGLRQKWIAAEWVSSDAPSERMFAVLFEMTDEAGTATVIAAEDGTASLYTSRGGGMIGIGESAPVAAAASRLADEARALAHEFPSRCHVRPAAGG